jgi:hypothetical protein
MLNIEYPHGAVIRWSRHFRNEDHWNDVAIWGIENFGLPGTKYITEVNVDDMTWWFRTKEDRLLFVLRNGHAQCKELCSIT